MSSSEAWSWARCLAEWGVILFVNANGHLESRWPINDPDLVAWIKQHKNEILAELKAELRAHEKQ